MFFTLSLNLLEKALYMWRKFTNIGRGKSHLTIWLFDEARPLSILHLRCRQRRCLWPPSSISVDKIRRRLWSWPTPPSAASAAAATAHLPLCVYKNKIAKKQTFTHTHRVASTYRSRFSWASSLRRKLADQVACDQPTTNPWLGESRR